MTFHGGRISVFADFSSPTSARFDVRRVVTRQHRMLPFDGHGRPAAHDRHCPWPTNDGRGASAALPAIRDEADCVELRLDLFEEPFDLPLLLRERG